jgi:trimethylamine--corrinoid protein Co-methyltransferase
MRVNETVNVTPQFEILSEDQKQEIFRAAQRILWHTGVMVHDPEALQVLRDAGARIDGERAYIPGYIVKEALATTPSSFTVYSWSGDAMKDIEIGPNRVYYGPGPTPPYVRDARTYERRKFVRSDAAAVAKVCDALDGIGFVESLGTISDVHPDLADVYEFAEMIAHTDKPIVAWSYTVDTCRDIHEVAMAVAGGVGDGAGLVPGRWPNYIFYAEPLSPLASSREAAEKLVYCARHRIPLIYTSIPMCGGTGPATFAGNLALNLAEALHGVVISQAISPGTPHVIGGVVSIMDMASSVLAYGAPELSLLSAAQAEMARYVGVPTWSTGGCTDSKVLDQQAALEGALSVLFAGLSGADLVHDVGYTESGITGSMHQLVMMDEAIQMVQRIMQGIEVSEETLAVDVIDRVGPGGHFLADDHTYDHYRREFWFPTVMDRQRWSDWEAAGKSTLGDRIQARLDEILDTHQPAQLPAEVRSCIEEILAAAEARVAASSDA